ncbi:tyrosine-type recombinase/integrase [Halomonas sp. LR5S13]|uniref:tyrosine-type recombinase/integrase n=1 Tax=Halomonas rhizosphaerae TaxID=3043296 RepID=UPI0024A8D476|nr:tyrosine-type recombinase/integrase [Halomonas rhizosphaerae]MDI5922517.1 tyrosine-type recombinase/integrase [Halomonas rhizosphaerae]
MIIVKQQRDLAKLIKDYGWPDIPDCFSTRDRKTVQSGTDTWVLPDPGIRTPRIDFSIITDHSIKWAVKSYIKMVMETQSSRSANNDYADLRRLVICKLDEHYDDLEGRLIEVYEDLLSESREAQKTWQCYRVFKWYLWCADNYPELGFSEDYANRLDAVELGGNPKGYAVKSEDPAKGPLAPIEFKLLISALKNDDDQTFSAIQQRAAISLLIATGRNPQNLTFLRESDLMNVAPEGVEPCYILKMPRIKKGFLSPRDDLLEESIDEAIAGHIVALIDKNKEIRDDLKFDRFSGSLPDALFINTDGNSSALLSYDWDNALNMSSQQLSLLVERFSSRVNIVSPVTKKILRIYPRRLRYTFACNMVSEGVSRRELARMLDHSDTQNVGVYYQVASKIVPHLDKAMAKEYASILGLFRGKVVTSDAAAVNGDREDKHLSFHGLQNEDVNGEEIGVCGDSEVCHLDPPYSCYLCHKFQPYATADHDHVLSCLLENREEKIKKYESKRIGVQLDDVIIAVAEVAERCKESNKNA